jgi:DNA invertase Pin-like site-specific DNA recombinase
VLVVTKLDRLARSVADLSSIVAELERKGASLRVLNAAIDTSTATGRAFLNMLGVFSEFENDIRRERQAPGIAEATRKGVYMGRSAKIDAGAVTKLKAEGLGPTAVAKRLKISRPGVYRVLG